MRAVPVSPFDTLEAGFRLLTSEPAALALDGRQVGHGAPARRIPLGELRNLGFGRSHRRSPRTPRSTGPGTSDTALREAMLAVEMVESQAVRRVSRLLR
jgi:hypothetical protein